MIPTTLAPEAFVGAARHLVASATTTSALDAPIELDDLLVVDDGQPFGAPGDATFVIAPSTADLSRQLAEAADTLRRSSHTPRHLIIVTRETYHVVDSALSESNVPFGPTQTHIVDRDDFLDRLSHYPEIWSEHFGTDRPFALARAGDARRLRQLFASRPESQVLREFKIVHPELPASTSGARLVGRRGSGKSIASLQLIQRSLTADALVCVVSPVATAQAGREARDILLGEALAGSRELCIVFEDFHEHARDDQVAFLTYAKELRKSPAAVTILLAYDSGASEELRRELLTKHFDPLGLSEYQLDMPPGSFLSDVGNEFARALQLSLTQQTYEAVGRVTYRHGNTPLVLARFLIEAAKSSMDAVLKASRPDAHFWQQRLRLQRPHARAVLQILAFLRFADIEVPSYALVEYFFTAVYGGNPQEWVDALASLRDAGVLSVSRGQIYADVPPADALPEGQRIVDLDFDRLFTALVNCQ